MRLRNRQVFVIFSRAIVGAALAVALSCTAWAVTPAEGMVVNDYSAIVSRYET